MSAAFSFGGNDFQGFDRPENCLISQKSVKIIDTNQHKMQNLLK